MRILRVGGVMCVLLALLSVVFSSCIPRWPKRFVYPYREVITMHITDECEIVLDDGSSAAAMKTAYGMPFNWVNDSGNIVVVKFDSYDVIGRWAIRLNPGESYLTLLRSTMVKGESYPYTVICKGEKEEETEGELKGDGPPPPIKDDPPPGGDG